MRVFFIGFTLLLTACKLEPSKPKRNFNAIIKTEDLTILNMGIEEKEYYFQDTSIKTAYDTLCKYVAAQYRTGQILKGSKVYKFVGADLLNENGESVLDSVPPEYLEVPLQRYGVPNDFWVNQ